MSTEPRDPLLSPEALLEVLATTGAELAAAAGRAGLDAAVPSCPGWDVRELLRHTGGVHRWATTHVRDQVNEAIPESDDLESFVGGWPGDAALIDWFVEGHAALLRALREAPEERECFTFLPAPSAKWFWTRRQAHETAMHAIDVLGALGEELELTAAFCGDGLDEMLRGFAVRMRRRLASPHELQLTVLASGTEQAYLVRFGEGAVVVELLDPALVAFAQTAFDGATARLTGPASALYRWSWSRQGHQQLAIEGAAEVVEHFERAAHVTWS